jgi:magnesium-transporting ATPase (P-type)
LLAEWCGGSPSLNWDAAHAVMKVQHPAVLPWAAHTAPSHNVRVPDILVTALTAIRPRLYRGVCLQASSPDEEALVQGAAFLGYKLIERTTECIKVSVHGKEQKYDLLATLEFNSDRKRMSIVVQTPEKKVLLMCKGADSIILARLANSEHGVTKAEEHLVS